MIRGLTSMVVMVKHNKKGKFKRLEKTKKVYKQRHIQRQKKKGEFNFEFQIQAPRLIELWESLQ